MTLADAVWSAPDYPGLLHEQLEGEHFIFNPHTGHTHVLNEVALRLLGLLAKRPLTVDQLAQRLRTEGTRMSPGELRDLLEQLQLLGLTEARS